MISYNQLLQFVTVVQNRSISKAAEKMFVAQPAVSASIKKMETELGVQLFYYENKRLHLTEDGKDIYKIASEILFSYAKLENYKAYTEYEEYTYFRYYASTAIHDCLTPRLDLLNQFPRMRFSFYNCHTHDEFQDFLDCADQLENTFGIFFIPADKLDTLTFSDQLTIQVIASFPTLLVTSLHTKHPLCAKKSLTVKELHDIAFIDYANNLCQLLPELTPGKLVAPSAALINNYLKNYPDTFIIGCLPFTFLEQDQPAKRIPITDAPAVQLVLIYHNTEDLTFYTQLFSFVHSFCAI